MRWLTFLLLTILFWIGSVSTAQDNKKEELQPIPTVDLKRNAPIEYNTDIAPIFENKCFVCHSGKLTEGDFDMSSYEKLMKGGRKRGTKVIIPGKAEESYLFLACARRARPIMPPKTETPLTPQELSLLKLWIDQGAKAPTTTRVRAKVVVGLPPALVKPVRAVVVAPDGKQVIASRGNQIHIYVAQKKQEAGKKEVVDWVYQRALVDPNVKWPDGKPAGAAHVSLVESLAISADGKTLASGSFQEVILWDLASGQIRQRLTGFVDRVTALAFSGDGKYLAVGGGPPSEEGELKLFDAASAQLITEMKNAHSDTVFALAFSPDGKYLASGAADKFVKVFEVPSGKFVKSFEGHTHHVMGVGWTPDSKRLVSGSADNIIKVWDFDKGEKIRDMPGHQKQITALMMVGKTTQFLTVSGDTTARLWNADNGATIRQFAGAGDFLYSVSVSPDGEVVATGCEDGLVRLYDGKTGTLLKALTPGETAPSK
jgi:WD40 repeat protein